MSAKPNIPADPGSADHSCDVPVTQLGRQGSRALRCVEIDEDGFLLESEAPIEPGQVLRLRFEMEPPVEFLAQSLGATGTGSRAAIRARPLALSEEQERRLGIGHAPQPRATKSRSKRQNPETSGGVSLQQPSSLLRPSALAAAAIALAAIIALSLC